MIGDLYRRSLATLLACWERFARDTPGASVARFPGVVAAVFPAGPERAVYNNAVLERDLDPAGRHAALDSMERSYAAAGVDEYAAWVHESATTLRRDIERRGYTIAETTRSMAMPLAALNTPRPEVELVVRGWDDYARTFGLPTGLLIGVDRSAFDLLVARVDGDDAATSLAFDFEGDRGIYNVVTLERFRRRGLGTALTALQLHDARERGCVTASLQASPMAERMYAAMGFRDLGRFLEYRRRSAVS